MTTKPKSIKNIDPEVYKEAIHFSIDAHLTMGKLITLALSSFMKNHKDQEAHRIAENMEDTLKHQGQAE